LDRRIVMRAMWSGLPKQFVNCGAIMLRTAESIVEWNKSYLNGDDVRVITERQIEGYLDSSLQSE
jgi:hypothetical protein